MQRAYLDGLSEDESVPFQWKEPEPGELELTPGVSGPVIREGVDIGARVLDLSAMRAELEAERAKRERGEA